MSAPNNQQLAEARAKAAAEYPEYLVDTMGRQHRSIVREGILKGAYDGGDVVRRYLPEIARLGEKR